MPTARRGHERMVNSRSHAHAKPLSITRKSRTVTGGSGLERGMNHWTTPELGHVNLGDRRLNRRLHHLVTALAARPEAGVPEATGSRAAAKAAYRFWDNDRVRPDAIH